MIRINNPQYFHFLQQADALRHSGTLCDAIISVKSQTFRAHRLVLSCASRRLAQRLALGDIGNPVHCKLDYFSPHTFQQVLDFTYTQTLEVPVDDLHLLLRAAQLLEMQPLEDQCRKHLDNIHCKVRQESKIREIINIKKETESKNQKTEEKQKESRALEWENSLTSDEACDGIVMESISPTGPLKNHFTSPPSTKNKSRPPPVSATVYNRESVITRPVSSGSSSSPWAFPNMWNSVSTLRRIAENYSSLVAAQPVQPLPQSVAYPFPLASSHMLPLLGSHFQSSVIAYSGFHPGHEQNLYVGSTRMGSIINQGLLKRKRKSQTPFNETVQTSERSHNGPAASIAQHTSTRLLDDPVLQDSASTPSGEACAGCQFSGSDGAQRKPKSYQQEHRGGKPYQCQHCPKRFSLKHQLDTHLRVHTGEKPFECRLCGQRSRDYSAMIKHLRTHGGASPYQCTLCLEFCSSLVAMQRHVKSHALQDFPQNWSINSTYLYKSHV
ncbi:zinc finger and BTB domain-containing protein 16 [Brachionichthys hirsutus]|uniref:zinc finger and BTB domain-containing protein 16 n=1 Tax=Brachionichthys hirsutus TaxID=412623 RepID=UPI003604A27B